MAHHRSFLLCAHRWQGNTYVSTSTSRGCYLGQQRLPPLPPSVLCARQVTANTFPAACAASYCQGSCHPGPTSLGEHTVRLRLLQLHVGLCCRRYSLHILIVTAISLPPPSLSEQVSPNPPLLSPPLAWEGNRRLREAHTQRRGENQS